MGSEPVYRLTLERVRQLLAEGAEEKLGAYLDGYHPSDLADLMEALDEAERIAILKVLPVDIASETLVEMEEAAEPEDLLLADPGRAVELVKELSADDAADILAELSEAKQAEVLSQLPPTDAGELRELMSYDEESAGGVMTTEVVGVQESATVSEAIHEIRRQAAAGEEDFYAVFVVDGAGRLRGTVSFQSLIVSPPDTPIREVTEPPMVVVPPDMDQEEVARLMSRYNLVSVPVVDPLGRLIGRITFDDVMDIVETESTEDILRLAGTSAEEYVRGGVGEAVRKRLPWLYVNLVTASVTATIIYLFQSTIESAARLVMFMPVIAGLGGNAGTQALAVTVRRLALAPEGSVAWKVVLKEVAVGLANGAALGVLVAIVGFFVGQRSLDVGLVVMAAMWGNLLIAGFAGAFVPVSLEKLGVDPAVASSVFVTALTDVCGYFFMLSLATWLLLPQL
jgi:magnesium transporter